jgi:hypothetical protein
VLEAEAGGVGALGVPAGLNLLTGATTWTDELIESARSNGARKGNAALVICRDFGGAGGSVPGNCSLEEDRVGDVTSRGFVSATSRDSEGDSSLKEIAGGVEVVGVAEEGPNIESNALSRSTVCWRLGLGGEKVVSEIPVPRRKKGFVVLITEAAGLATFAELVTDDV